MLFTNWGNVPEVFQNCTTCGSISGFGEGYGNRAVVRVQHCGIWKYVYYGPDQTLYVEPTLNGRGLSRGEFCKIFYHGLCDEIVRGYKCIVLKLKLSAGGDTMMDPPNKQLHVVMRQVDDVERTSSGDVVWRWVWANLPCYRESYFGESGNKFVRPQAGSEKLMLDRTVAVMMGSHARLGAGSSLGLFEKEVMQLICDLAWA